MTEQEYFEQLRNIYSIACSDEADTRHEELLVAVKEMYNIKPVRLLWFVVRAKLAEKSEDVFKYWNKVHEANCAKSIFNETNEYIEYFQSVNRHYQNIDDEISFPNRFEEQNILNDHNLKRLFVEFCKTEDDNVLFELMIQYYRTNSAVVLQIIFFYLQKKGYTFPRPIEFMNWRLQDTNVEYLFESLANKERDFVLVVDENNQRECDLLAFILHQLGHHVHMIMPEVEFKEGTIENMVDDAIHSAQIFDDSICYQSGAYIDDVGYIISDKTCLIRSVVENKCQDKYAIIVATGNDFDYFCTDNQLRKIVEEMCWHTEQFSEKQLQWGRVGNYLTFCSDIYQYDVECELEKKFCEPAAVDFSIVIPARNAAGTLYYTLKTCLDQDYVGTYEIVVSDNSTEGRCEVYDVCKDLDDPRIHYVKTPRNLPLTKSFEFAFLQAKGEFIFSIGADDGVCPWALSVIKKVIDSHPKDEIIQWKRGYYCWKGYPGSKEGLFSVPGRFDKNNIKVEYQDNMTYFAKILKYSFNMYALPTMYVNAGFHRRYLRTLIEKTGRLWDGNNQDLYMGVVSAAINEKILNINFPLTLVGISSNSLGYVVSKPRNEESSAELEAIQKSTYLGANVCTHMYHKWERLIPCGTGENFSLYVNILRAIQLGVLPENWLTELIDFKKVFREFYVEHRILDDSYGRLLQEGLDASSRHGVEFAEWFFEEIYKPAVQPKYYCNTESSEPKRLSYTEGVTDEGELFLNAVQYGVTNIEEAVNLFSYMIEWREDSWQDKLYSYKL